MSSRSNTGVRCSVVGYDRTESSRGAVAWAASEMADTGKLVLVHSSRGLHTPASPLLSGRERRELGRALIDELMLEGDDSLFDLDIEADISEHDPVTALIAAAERHQAQLIVVGSDRHSPLHKALGTVTSELMSRSPVPVTVIGPEAGLPATPSPQDRDARSGNPA